MDGGWPQDLGEAGETGGGRDCDRGEGEADQDAPGPRGHPQGPGESRDQGRPLRVDTGREQTCPQVTHQKYIY